MSTYTSHFPASTPPTNRFLESLATVHRDRILHASKQVALPVRTVLAEVGRLPKYAYFLTSGFASIVVELAEGGVAEVALIGREGVVGGLQLLGPALSPARCFIQMEATAYRIPLSELGEFFLKDEEIRARILEWVQQQSLTITQLSACNKLHEAEPRLARWLLMVRDRVEQDTLNLTQEFLAQMLGTQRTTVVMVAGSLQRSGLITYGRGKVTLLSPDDLEEAACNCYKIVRRLYTDLYAK
jgi:CRP-like cAMP-binding protein